MRTHKFFRRLTFFGLTGLLVAGGFLACHHHRDPVKRVLKHMDNTVDDLDFNANQDARYQTLRSKIESEMNQARGDHKILAQKLKVQFNKDEADINEVASLLKEHQKNRKDRMAKVPDYIVEFYEILNKEQKKEMNAKVNKLLDRFLSHVD